jgi:hypothetical protein
MAWLLAAEHGADPPWATDDIDLVVDICAEPTGIRDLCHCWRITASTWKG